ncbi:MAG: FecR domain-containing protein [Rhizomicrobium sp.]
MTERPSAQNVYDQAALWAAKSDAGPLHPGEQAELDAWLSEDVRHVGAFALASAHLTPLQQHDAPSRQAERPAFSRRRVVLGGGIAAAAAGLAVVGRSALRYFGEERYATRVGEMRVVPLNDGSLISLNTQSEVVVRYSRNRRDIDLIQGEALFDVAKNTQRPFVVHAADTAVRAVGTSFTVRILPSQPVQILVKEGVVEVTRPDIPVAPPVRAPANTRAIAPVNAPIVAKPIETAEVERALAWRDGRIAFHGETLGVAADEFARYSDIRIRIDDPSIAEERIAGLFLAGDPIGFAHAVAVSFDLRVAVADNEVRLSRQ